MKIAIIGAGMMGGAIARCLLHKNDKKYRISVSNRTAEKLDALKIDYPYAHTTINNREAAEDADVIIIAVKPHQVAEVLKPLRLRQPQLLVSLAAGISIEALAHYVDPEMAIFRAIPNTAISVGQSLTLIAHRNATSKEVECVPDIFETGGIPWVIDEKLFPAATSLTSCGIAFLMKYVEGAMLAAIETGIPANAAMEMVAQTMKGAAQILLDNPSTRPSIEIEKVTTPGGITIQGVNTLEHSGFVSAVIRAVKASIA